MRFAIVLVLLFLVGCAAEQEPACDGSFHAHRTLTPEARAHVEVAFAKWNELAGRDVARFVEGDPDDVTCSVRIDENAGALGLFSHEDGSLALAPARLRTEAPGCAAQMGDCIEAVALHETGHALGLVHTSDAGHVMSPDGELLLAFTDADRAECSRAGVCAR
jgi:hypothetical protein